MEAYVNEWSLIIVITAPELYKVSPGGVDRSEEDLRPSSPPEQWSMCPARPADRQTVMSLIFLSKQLLVRVVSRIT